MPLFMDTHNVGQKVSADELTEAHKKDLEVQDQYDVDYKQFWYNEQEGKVFCLVEAPDAETAEKVHREAHGMTADEIVEVKEGE